MTSADEWLRIESLDLEAQGVAHNADGKVVFVEDALPGEEVQVARHAAQEQLGAGVAGRAAPRERRSASCRAARTSASAAAARCSTSTSPRRSRPSSARSRTRSGTSARSGPSSMLRPIEGPAWGYR